MDTFRINWRTSSYSTGNGGQCVEVGSWRKSRHSGQEGHCVEFGVWQRNSHSTQQGNCVEVNTWRKSSRSANDGSCVEVAADEAVVLARDSKDPDGPVLGFGADAWAAFLTTVKDGHLDLR